jgi:hypothetical protein
MRGKMCLNRCVAVQFGLAAAIASGVVTRRPRKTGRPSQPAQIASCEMQTEVA